MAMNGLMMPLDGYEWFDGLISMRWERGTPTTMVRNQPLISRTVYPSIHIAVIEQSYGKKAHEYIYILYTCTQMYIYIIMIIYIYT